MKVKIEIQDQFGKWQYYKTIDSVGTQVSLALKSAIKTQLAMKNRKVRAVDKNGFVIDFLYS
jgi:hypothetical protein